MVSLIHIQSISELLGIMSSHYQHNPYSPTLSHLDPVPPSLLSHINYVTSNHLAKYNNTYIHVSLTNLGYTDHRNNPYPLYSWILQMPWWIPSHQVPGISWIVHLIPSPYPTGLPSILGCSLGECRFLLTSVWGNVFPVSWFQCESVSLRMPSTSWIPGCLWNSWPNISHAFQPQLVSLNHQDQLWLMGIHSLLHSMDL